MTSKRIAAASLVVLLGLGGAVVTATAASAEGEASTDTTAAPVAPTEEVTSSPDTQTAPESPTTSPASTDSATPSTETPEATEQQPADSATVASPQTPASQQRVSPASIPTADPYVVAIWEMLPNGDKFPQKLIASQVTASTDVHALDSKATKCGTSYQSDLYANDKITGALITKAILNGGDESWPGGTYQSKFSNTFTTPKCTVTTIAVPDLTVLPPTCDTAGSLPLTTWPAAQNPNGYEGDGFRVYLDKAYTGAGTYKATVQKVGPGFDPKYPAGTKVTGNLLQTLVVLPATGHQSTNPNGACYVPPVLEQCTTTTAGTVFTEQNTTAAMFSETRATGHYEFTGNALHVWTEGATSTDKVAFYFPISTSFAGLGEPSLNATVPAGIQIVTDFDGDGSADGILVGEAGAYGTDWWLSNSAAQFVKDGAPLHTGGSGSANHGTLGQWLAAFPSAAPQLGGFSLGSGVKADGLVKSITIGCKVYTFAHYTPPVIPPTELPVVVPPVTDTPTPTPSVTPTEVPTASVQRLASTGVDGTYLILGAGGLFVIVMGLIAIAITLGQRKLRRHEEHLAAIESGDIDPLA